MRLHADCPVTVTSSDQFFDVMIRIPKSDIDVNQRKNHEITMFFNEIILFSETLMNANDTNSERKKYLQQILNDLYSFYKEFCWIKSIHQKMKTQVSKTYHSNSQ